MVSGRKVVLLVVTPSNGYTSPTRGRHYDSDLTDDEWRLVQPLIEVAQTGPGPRRSVDLREVLNAVLYKQRTGCQWRMLPHDLPPRSTVSGYFQRWSRAGVLDQVYAMLQSGRLGRAEASLRHLAPQSLINEIEYGTQPSHR